MGCVNSTPAADGDSKGTVRFDGVITGDKADVVPPATSKQLHVNNSSHDDVTSNCSTTVAEQRLSQAESSNRYRSSIGETSQTSQPVHNVVSTTTQQYSHYAPQLSPETELSAIQTPSTAAVAATTAITPSGPASSTSTALTSGGRTTLTVRSQRSASHLQSQQSVQQPCVQHDTMSPSFSSASASLNRLPPVHPTTPFARNTTTSNIGAPSSSSATVAHPIGQHSTSQFTAPADQHARTTSAATQPQANKQPSITQTGLSRSTTAAVIQPPASLAGSRQTSRSQNSLSMTQRFNAWRARRHYKGVTISAKDLNVDLHESCKDGNIKRVNACLALGADINALHPKDGYTPLITACFKNRVKVVKLLCKYPGIDLQAVDRYDKASALIWSAFYGQVECIQRLLKSGAQLEQRDKDGYTALITAAIHGQQLALTLLLSKGADIEARDLDGRTPLSWAAAKNHLQIARLLITAGADVNTFDHDGDTPIHTAAQFSQYDMVSLLLLHGAQRRTVTSRLSSATGQREPLRRSETGTSDLEMLSRVDKKLAETLERHELSVMSTSHA